MDPRSLTYINRPRQGAVAPLYRDAGRAHLRQLLHPSLLPEPAVLPRILVCRLRPLDLVVLLPEPLAARLWGPGPCDVGPDPTRLHSSGLV